MRKLLFSIVIMACAASFSFAQNSDYNKLDVYAGYSHARLDDGSGEYEGFNGVEGSVTGNISRYIGLKGDYTFHFKKFEFGTIDVDAQTHTLVGGVQIKDNSTEKKLKPFAHFMAGFAHGRADVNQQVCIQQLGVPCPSFNDSETGFAGVIGGGLDIRLNNRVDIRAVQFDYNPTHLAGTTQHNFRIGVGVVFR